jgi:hypothetical protein
MFPRYRHAPILDTGRKRCPVCHHAVYSLAGIHPQCAVRLAELPTPKHKAKGVVGQVKVGVDAVADRRKDLGS